MTISTTPKGLLLPTVKPVPGGSPGAAAIKIGQQQTTSQAKMVNAIGGRKKSQRGGIGKVVVPQMSLNYYQTSGKGQGVNDTIAQNAGDSMQASQNAKYDHLATKGLKGGARRKTKKVIKRKTVKKRKTAIKKKIVKKRKTVKKRRMGGALFKDYSKRDSGECNIDDFKSIEDPKQQKKTYKKCCRNYGFFKTNADKNTCSIMGEQYDNIKQTEKFKKNKLKNNDSGFRRPIGQQPPLQKFQENNENNKINDSQSKPTTIPVGASVDTFESPDFDYDNMNNPIIRNGPIPDLSIENAAAIAKAKLLKKNNWRYRLVSSSKECQDDVEKYIGNINHGNRDAAVETYNKCCIDIVGSDRHCNLLRDDLTKFDKLNEEYPEIQGVSGDSQNTIKDQITL